MEHSGAGTTPEKQLLKLIEQPGLAEQQKGTLKRRGGRFLSLSALKGRLSFMCQRVRGRFGTRRGASGLKTVNRALVCCVVAGAAYLGWDIVCSVLDLRARPEVEAAEERSGVANVFRTVLNVGPVISDVLRTRSPFGFRTETDAPEEIVIGAEAKKIRDEAAELQRNWKFRGLSRDGDDLVAFIEDTETGKWYRVRVGDMIRGLTVIKIMDDKVIFEYKKAEIELKE